MSLKSFFSLSRMCFDVLSIKRQRHRKQRESGSSSQIYCTGYWQRQQEEGVGRSWRGGEKERGTDDTVYPTEGEAET